MKPVGAPVNHTKRVQRRVTKSHSINARKRKTARNKRREKKSNVLRGREVTVREASSEAQVIYGEMRVGGVITFADLSDNSHAYLVTGSSDSQIGWTARTGGTIGNTITIEIVTPSGSSGTTIIGVIGAAITVFPKMGGSTANEVIAAIQAHAPADALVSVNKLDGDGTDNVSLIDPTPLVEGGGTWFHLYITLACHEIDGVGKLYLDDREVTFGATPDPRWGTGIWANRVFMAVQTGLDSQPVQPDLFAQRSTLWTANHRQRGFAGVYLILRWDKNVFTEGEPEISFLVRGKKVYDPRTGLTVWTSIAALCIADFLTNTRFGLGIDYADLNEAQLIASANICDTLVSTQGAVLERQYLIDGVFDTSMDKFSVLDDMLAAMSGDIVRESEEWFIYSGYWREPTFALTQDDIIGEIKVNTNVPRSESFNSVRGTFVHPESNYQEQDAPMVTNSTYVTEDGGVKVYEDLTLNFVQRATHAMRVMKIALEKVRQGISISIPCKLTALAIRAGDTVTLTLSQFGWSAKEFEVEELTFQLEDSGAVIIQLELRETAEEIFDPTGIEYNVDIADDTNLPDPRDVDEPTDVTLESGTDQLFTRLDGTIFSRLKVSWTGSVTEFVASGGHYEIQYRKSADSAWTIIPSIPGEAISHYILDVEDGVSYDVRICAVNTLDYHSDWVQVDDHVVLGKTEPPDDVTGLSASISDTGVRVIWTKVNDIDAAGYEVRVDGENWGSSELIAKVSASGNAYLWSLSAIQDYLDPTNLTSAATYTIRVKAVDTSGNYSTDDSSVVITIITPDSVRNLNGWTVRNNVLIDWTAPASSSLSIAFYEVFKGATYDDAVKIGTANVTFFTYVERTGGTFNYWIVPVDLGNNRGIPVGTSVSVTDSDDFYIRDTINLVTGTGVVVSESYLAIIGGSTRAPGEDPETVWLPFVDPITTIMPLMYPQVEEQSWEDWWDENGWITWRDAMEETNTLPLTYPHGSESGYAGAYPTPSPTEAGFLEFQYDYGLVFSSGTIDLTWLQVNLAGNTTVTPSISHSEDGTTWTSYPGASQVFASNFQYVRYRFDFQGQDDTAFAKLTDIIGTIKLEIREEYGQVAVDLADAGTGGTVVNFTKDFLDVQDIQVTHAGSSFGAPVANFVDIPNPTSFKILLYNESGTAISGNVNYRIIGAVNP